MSDLDELRPFLIDDMIIKAAAGELKGMSELEIANLMSMKVQTVDQMQENLEIQYETDELVVAIDYWVNKILDRPINGLGVVTPPEIAPAEEKFLGGAEEIVVDEVAIVPPSEIITNMEP